MSQDRTALEGLLERVRAATGPDRILDRAIGRAFGYSETTFPQYEPDGIMPAFTASLDDAMAMVERVLPGFWQSSGLCSLTGHASIGPDYNGQQAERLRQEWPEERFHEGFHADLKPGDGRHRQCLALIDTVLQAVIAKLGSE